MRWETFKSKACSFLFVLAIVLSLFNGIHEDWVPKIIYTFLANTTLAAIYPLFLLSLIIFVDCIVSKKISKYKPLLFFFFFYIGINFIVNLHGIITFKYAEYVKIENITGITKFCFDLIKRFVPSISGYLNWAIVFMIRNTFNSIVEFYSLWFVIYSVALYCLQDEKLYKHISIGMHISIAIVCFYEIFEIAYFMGKDWGAKFLETVNPYIIPVGKTWPALPSGIRNVFHEQSYYAYWACMAISFFLYGFIEKKNWYDLAFAFFLMGCMVGGNSRTGVALVCIELVVIFGCLIFVKKKKAIKPILIICGFLIIALAIGIGFLANRSVNSTYQAQTFWEKVVLFLDGTMGTLFDKTRRSNPSRFGMRDAEIKTWLESPIFGVGAELKGFYIIENYPDYGGEVGSWFNAQIEVGSAPYHLPALNQFTSALASGGLVGFMATNMPMIAMALILFAICLKKQAFVKTKEIEGEVVDNSPYLYVLAAVIVILAFGFSCNVFISGLAFMIPGLALSYLMRASKNKN